MPLAAGQSLSFYEILGPLGVGGMGEVYRARDTRLEREVAIKVLPEKLADDDERLRRFEREAKTLASLNHPNVAGIYGVDREGDVSFLALELVPGEDLATRLERGPLAVDEAIEVSRQIAEGLEGAHEAGVVHRDLKPANIRITPDGVVKLLDFGLAKPMLERSSDSLGSPGSSGVAKPDSVLMTEEGRVLGTPTYMSPEQARGKPMDRRTDVWAFGCVLFECLTGERAFVGGSTPDVLVAIVGEEPDWTALPGNTPANVRRLLRRCLTKEARNRLRDMGDARLTLQECQSGVFEAVAHEAGAGEATRRGAFGAVALGLGALLLGALLARAFWMPSRRPQVVLRPLVAELTAPDGARVVPLSGPPAVSPDGKRVAFVAVDGEGTSALWVRELDGDALARRIPGSESATNPFWAPEGRRLGFRGGDDLLTIGVDEDRPQLLFRGNPGSNIVGAAWNQQNRILFAEETGPLLSVDARGGTPEVVLDHSPDRQGTRAMAMWPSFLPDGKGFLFTIQDASGELSGLHVGETESATARRLLPETTNAVYVEPGWLVYRRGDALYARAFDARTRVLGEETVRLAKDVRVSEWPAHALFGASRAGRIVYYRNDASLVESEFVWFDRASGATESLGVEGVLWNPRLSHDGRKLAFDRTSVRTSGDLWVRDLVRGSEVRLTEATSDDSAPVWTPGDDGLYFHMMPDLYYAKASGVGGVEPILESVEFKVPVDLSADGRSLLWCVEESGVLSALDLETRESRSIFEEAEDARLSPDGAWLAVEVRVATELYVALQTYPGGEHFTRVSTGPGRTPRWAPAGDEILFDVEGEIVAVPVELTPGAAPRPGEPRVVVPRTGPDQYLIRRGFDITPDGERLLLVRSLMSDASALTVLENAIPSRP